MSGGFLLEDLPMPMDVALAGDDVYVASYGNGSSQGSITRVSRFGGSAEVMHVGSFVSVAADSGLLAFSDYASGDIGTIDLESGEVAVATNSPQPQGIALRSGDIFWADGQDVHHVAAAGGGVTVIASGTSAVSVAVTESRVYWGGQTQNHIGSANYDGSERLDLDTADATPHRIGIAADTIYFTDLNRGTVSSIPLSGGTYVDLVSDSGDPSDVEAASGLVFWSDPSASTVGMIEESVPVVLTDVATSPRAVAGDSRCVFWVEDNGRLRALLTP